MPFDASVAALISPMNRPSAKSIKNANELLASPWGKAAAQVKNPRAVAKQAAAIARKYPASPLAQRVGQVASMVEQSGINGQIYDPKTAIVLIAALLYLISPIDFIPDMIPVVGWLDDLGVLAIAAYYARGLFHSLFPGKQAEVERAPEEEDLVDEVVLKVQSSERIFRSGSKLQDELTRLQQEAEELDDEVLAEQCQELQQVALDPVRRVIVTGTFNAGKTSLINRLLGESCLPVGVLPTTRVLTTLLHGDSLLAVSSLKGGGVESTTDASALRNATSPFYKDMSELVVYHPAEILDNGFSIVDTPGLRDKTFALDFESLPRSDSFVYVKSLTVADFTADELAFLAEAAGHVSAEQMILVLSKTDTVDDPLGLDQVERDMRLTLMKYGLGNIPIFRVTDRGTGDQLPELRQELLARAENSMEQQHEARVKQAANAMREAITRTRNRRAELEQLSAEERAKRQARLEAKVSRACDLIQRRVDSFKDLARADLHDYLFAKLYPAVCRSIETSSVNEKYVGQLTVQIRNELGTYLESKCRELANQLGGSVGEDDVLTLHAVTGTGDLSAPEQVAGSMADYAKYVLPGIALATFFPMGIMAWVTTIAVPTFLLDKVGAADGLSSLLRRVGQNGARSRLKEGVQAFLQELERLSLQRINDFLDRTGKQVCQAQTKQMEMQD